LEELRALFAQTKRKLVWFRLPPLSLLFSLLPLWLLAVLIPAAHIAAVLVLPRFGIFDFTWQQAGLSCAAWLAGVFILYFLGRLLSERPARTLAVAIVRARELVDACQRTAEARYHQRSDRIRSEAEAKTDALKQRWDRAATEAAEMRRTTEQRLSEKLSRATARNDHLLQQALGRLQRERERRVESFKHEKEAERARLDSFRSARRQQFVSDQQTQWNALESEWKATTRSVYDAFAAARESVKQLFPEWRVAFWEKWIPPHDLTAAVPFARLAIDLEQLPGGVPRDGRLALPDPARFEVP
jgi:hypothetical protein